jgi:uncharacterized protein YPO0396
MATIDLSQLDKIVSEAKAELVEFEEANATLDSAKAELTAAQEVVAGKQTAVDTAREEAGTQKGDVLAKLQEMVTFAQSIIAELQG